MNTNLLFNITIPTSLGELCSVNRGQQDTLEQKFLHLLNLAEVHSNVI